MKKQRGFSLFELIVVLIIITALAGVARALISSIEAHVSMDVVVTQIVANINSARMSAKTGDSSSTNRTIDINHALPAKRPGVVISAQSTAGSSIVCQHSGCSSGLASICISGVQVCYSTTQTFTFNRFSGKLASPHAIFVQNKYRTFVLLITEEGKTDIYELLNGQWQLRG